MSKQYNRENPEPSSNINQLDNKFSKEYMIVTADKRASLAAKKILLSGGNALDAAIAAQNVLSVVEPQSSGLGGGGFMLFYNNLEKRIYAYDGRETASSLVNKNMFLVNEKKMNFIDAVKKPYSVGVPGLYTMLADAHSNFGKLDWQDLFLSALIYSEGFKMGKRLNKLLLWAPHIKNNRFVQDTYYSNGKVIKVGDVVKNLKLKESLEILSKNPYSLNKGLLAEKISMRLPNHILFSDLKKWRTILRNPLCKNINSYKVCGFPPPTSGGVGVIQILGILENKKMFIDKNYSFLSKHLFVEASKLAYKDRAAFIADPLYFKVPLNDLISDNYLKKRSNLISNSKAINNFKHGEIEALSDKSFKTGENYEKKSTTHISIIDKDGNAVALTSSIEFAFGSGITVGGFFLNNQLTDFSFISEGNKGELIVNKIEPNKKPRSSMSPTLIFSNDSLLGVLGSPGGSRIICYVTKVAYEILFLNIDPLTATKAPHYCSRGKFTEIENRNIDNKLKNYLTKKGHLIKFKDMTSGLNIIWKKNDEWQGIADPRREGFAIGE